MGLNYAQADQSIMEHSRKLKESGLIGQCMLLAEKLGTKEVSDVQVGLNACIVVSYDLRLNGDIGIGYRLQPPGGIHPSILEVMERGQKVLNATHHAPQYSRMHLVVGEWAIERYCPSDSWIQEITRSHKRLGEEVSPEDLERLKELGVTP